LISRMRTFGFTITEMLVVMLVIALLVSLAVPIYSSATAHAMRLRCANTLRHVGEAYHHRVAEERRMGRVHPISPDTWVDVLAPYLGNNPRAAICPEDADPTVGRPQVRLGIWSHGTYKESDLFNMYPYWLEGPCPDPGPGVWQLNDEDYQEFRALGDTQFYAPDVLGQYTPGANPDLWWLVIEEGRKDGQAGSEQDYNDLHGPSADKVLMLDYETQAVYIGGNAPRTQFWEEQVAPRHNGQVNVLFMGGQVEARSPEEINPEDPAIEQEFWSPDS
jgi:prepilin-type N-terminal cleavage/methylation domain-containing protein/prepilin-type processing-associated H-X9-DG protein